MAVRQRGAATATVVETKEVASEPQFPDIQTIRNTIPAHCFEPSLALSMYYVFRDLTMAGCLGWAALKFIPTIPSSVYRMAAWMLYGWVQGLVGTGIWILGHECGHGAFSTHGKFNNCMGWLLHSFLCVPYFSWKYSHHRHHRFTGHMDKDMAFVPATKEDRESGPVVAGVNLRELFEDTPIAQMIGLISHQLLGWQTYLLFNLSAGHGSLQREEKGLGKWLRVSHFDPKSAVFRENEGIYIFISDIGLGLMFSVLYFAAQAIGASNVFLLYGVPYMWVHHWLVAITYLHHTHADIPHYKDESWTFVKGALATVDRDFGFIGKHLFHGIIEKHVVHHLFPRIPFYKADEATEAIKPLLGDLYHEDRRSFLGQLWSAFSTLKYVEDDPTCQGAMKWAAH